MIEKHLDLSAQLRRLGFVQGNEMRLYGEVFEFLSDPIVMTDDAVFLDATEKRTGQIRRVRVPLQSVKIARRDHNHHPVMMDERESLRQTRDDHRSTG